MAEIKKNTLNHSELTQRFIEFVMMHAQQASLFLGKIPHPTTGETMQNLEAARLFIDQLEMLREKTQGNLSSEESEILNHVLSDLHFTYVEAVSPDKAEKPVAVKGEYEIEKEEFQEGQEGSEGKKKFSKNYGM